MEPVEETPDQLAAGRPAALFKLFVLLGTYQARRDVVIAEQSPLPLEGSGAGL